MILAACICLAAATLIRAVEIEARDCYASEDGPRMVRTGGRESREFLARLASDPNFHGDRD